MVWWVMDLPTMVWRASGHKAAIPELALLFSWALSLTSERNRGYVTVMSSISELPTTKLHLPKLSVSPSKIICIPIQEEAEFSYSSAMNPSMCRLKLISSSVLET